MSGDGTEAKAKKAVRVSWLLHVSLLAWVVLLYGRLSTLSAEMAALLAEHAGKAAEGPVMEDPFSGGLWLVVIPVVFVVVDILLLRHLFSLPVRRAAFAWAGLVVLALLVQVGVLVMNIQRVNTFLDSFTLPAAGTM